MNSKQQRYIYLVEKHNRIAEYLLSIELNPLVYNCLLQEYLRGDINDDFMCAILRINETNTMCLSEALKYFVSFKIDFYTKPEKTWEYLQAKVEYESRPLRLLRGM